jgi:hypothetical protein
VSEARDEKDEVNKQVEKVNKDEVPHTKYGIDKNRITCHFTFIKEID